MISGLPRLGATCLVAAATVGLVAAPALAQTCPAPLAVECGQIHSGDSGQGVDQLRNYSCLPAEDGPEVHHRLVLGSCARLEVELRPTGFDGALAVLPVSGGDCVPAACLDGADQGYAGAAESVELDVPPGVYMLSVDGYWGYDYGPYELEIHCTPYAGCADGDGDGHQGHDAGTCPCGADCDDADPDIHPGAQERCGDTVDEDCDGSADTCPACAATDAWTCGDSGAANLADGSSTVRYYCGSTQFDYYDYEYIASIRLDRDTTVGVEVDSESDVDLFVLEPYGRDDVCNPDRCAAYSIQDGSPESLAFFARADRTYFISTEFWSGWFYDFTYNLTCLNEQCQAGQALGCDAQVSGDTSGGQNQLSAYPGIPWGAGGPEEVYSFEVQAPSRIGLTLVIDEDLGVAPDLGLYVVREDAGGLCLAGGLVAYSDLIQDDTQNPAEVVELQVEPGVTYFVLVDSWRSDVYGSFTLTSTCEIQCPDGQEYCPTGCTDTGADLQNCGACEAVCAPAHATPQCAAGQCIVLACDDGWADCAGGAADGCETPLGTDQDCSACGDDCPALPHAAGSACDALVPACELVCDAGWGDCLPASLGCETDLLADEAHCGDCPTACAAGEFCWQGDCLTECPGALTRCDDACVDTDTDPLHCGGCNSPCQGAPHTRMECLAGECTLVGCDDGWADCGGASDGCETQLGTPAACSGCTDDCRDDFPHAAGLCQAGACAMGACAAGWGDCAGGAVDGCETQLGTDLDCAGCGDACADDFPHGQGSCQGGACALTGCLEGHGDCDDDPANGCETELGTASDCSACGDLCNLDHADATCTQGACAISACRAGWDDCDLEPANGCEADLSSAATCGDCETTCGATESCNGGVCESDCRDADGDGHQAASCGGDDCNDYDGLAFPGAEERCGNGADDDCDQQVDEGCTGCQDRDGDGAQDSICGGTDCDDLDGDVHPGAPEVCDDGKDQDCSGADLPCNCQDADGDGHQAASCGGDDCNDLEGTVHPGAQEVCGDSIDQDCQGGDAACGCADFDHDGAADAQCGGTDCNDQNNRVRPGAEETCGDGVDQDCDGTDLACPDGGGCGCGSPAGAGEGLLGLLGLLCLGVRRRSRRE